MSVEVVLLILGQCIKMLQLVALLVHMNHDDVINQVHQGRRAFHLILGRGLVFIAGLGFADMSHEVNMTV